MLSVESFAEVASFLAYYDLDGRKLTSRLLSAVAEECADEIRLFDFTNFKFYIRESWINVYRIEPEDRLSWVCRLELTSEENLAEFIAEAFRNCIVGRLVMMGRGRASDTCA